MEEKPEKTFKVFVYGSLKRGFYNYYGRLDGTRGYAKFLGEATTKGKMYNLGHFPAVNIDEEGTIHGEVFEVDENVVRALDLLEGYPTFYNRTKVPLSSGDQAWIYHIERELPEDQHIPSGEWIK